MMEQRNKFSIELRPGETTIVSWKKLLKDSHKSTPSTSTSHAATAIPPLQAAAAETQEKDGPETETETAPHRFSAVIEKIERLYVGSKSSDEEELGYVPDDDQYDTEDSFIDDADLDEYFQVDKSTTKHNGFFINKGKLESTNEPLDQSRNQKLSSPKHPRRKRRRDAMTTSGEMAAEHLRNKHTKVVNVKMKAAARTAPLLGGKSSSPSQSFIAKRENYYDENLNQAINHLGPSTKKSSDSNLKMEHSLSLNAFVLSLEAQGREKLKNSIIHSRDVDKGESSADPQLIHQDKVVPTMTNLQSRRSLNDMKEMEISVRQDKNVHRELPDLNFPSSESSLKTAKIPVHVKEGSNVRSKGSILEKAIRELEKTVSESRPQNMEVLAADFSSQAVKRRLPREVKQKLAKVARLASNQGKFSLSEELISRLMSILGHIMQRKSLKRNLKELIEYGVLAKKERDEKFQNIKKEVVEMIKMRPPSLKAKVSEQRDGSSGDFQELRGFEEKGVPKTRYSMENEMEDKICDLYDLYVEGMDEDKGPQIRKLYVELAELWPSGNMDNYGIKNAICRSKARKRAMFSRLKNQEKIKQKKLLSTPKSEGVVHNEDNSVARAQPVEERVIPTHLGSQVVSLLDGICSNTTTNPCVVSSERMSHSSTNGSSLNLPKHEKIQGSLRTYLDEVEKTTDHTLVKKKVKRKPESDIYCNPERLASQQAGSKFST